MSLSSSSDPYAALKIKEFQKFILGKTCFVIALQIQTVVVAWQIYSITKDALSLGLIGLAEAIPSIAISLFAGHIVDNSDRKKIILWALSILLVCSSLLWFFTLKPDAYILTSGTLPIYTVIFISGLARGFLGPAQFSILGQTLPDKTYYANAVSWNSTIWQASNVAGPAIGGFIFGLFNIQTAYGVDALLMLTSILLFTSLKSHGKPLQTEIQDIWKSLASGLKFVFSNQIILSAMALDLFAVLFGGAVALLPIFASEILSAGPQGLGILRAAPAIGSVLTIMLTAHFPIKKYAGLKMLICVAGFGLCMIGFGLSTIYGLSLILLVMSGAFDAISVVVRQTLIQTLTPENMKGRVSSVNSIFVGSSNEIGSFESGLTARIWGVVNSVVIGGTLTLAVVGITAYKAKKLRNLDL
jgi:MFS family permease